MIECYAVIEKQWFKTEIANILSHQLISAQSSCLFIMPIHILTAVYDSFYTTTVQLSSCDRYHVVSKPKTYDPFQKKFADPWFIRIFNSIVETQKSEL